jgi:ankyrin repeat protein
MNTEQQQISQERRIFKAKKPNKLPVDRSNLGPPKSLIKLINEGNRLDAINAIKNNNFIENERDSEDNTPLILACDAKMDDIALPLIASGKSEPEHISFIGETALIVACANKLKQVVKELVKINSSLVNITTINNETPLIISCSFPDTEDMAFDIFNTGKSIPEQVDDDNATALIMACSNKLINIALQLIDSGKSNWFIRDTNGFTALEYAIKNKLDNVVNALQKIDNNELTINLNDVGFNTIEIQDENINNYLLEDNNNLCFKYKNKYYLTNRSYIYKQLNNKVNINYRCIFAGDNEYDNSNNLISYDYTSDKNVVYSTEYFSMSILIGLPILVCVVDLNNIITNSYSSNVYLLSESGSLPALISLDYIDGGSGIGANHCQTGKKTTKCSIVRGLCKCESLNNNNSKPILQFNKSENNENLNDNKLIEIKIQYKTKTVIIPIQENTTIGQLKELLLEKLVSEGDIDNTTNKNVRLIYIGKIYGNDKNDQVVTSLPNFSSGITMASMIQQTQTNIGGKKKQTRKLNKKNIIRSRYTKSKIKK